MGLQELGETESLHSVAANGTAVPAVHDTWMNNNQWGNTEVLGKKPVPVPICTAQTSDGLPWDQIWASNLRS